MYGNILSVFGGPDESRVAWQILRDNNYFPEQIENTFFFQTAGEDASIFLMLQFRKAELHFTQVFINICYGSFVRSGGISMEQTEQVKKVLQMSL